MSPDKRFEIIWYHSNIPIVIGLDDRGVLNALRGIVQYLSEINYTGVVYFDDTYYKGFVPERFFSLMFSGNRFLPSTFELVNDKRLEEKQNKWWSDHEEYANTACFLDLTQTKISA